MKDIIDVLKSILAQIKGLPTRRRATVLAAGLVIAALLLIGGGIGGATTLQNAKDSEMAQTLARVQQAHQAEQAAKQAQITSLESDVSRLQTQVALTPVTFTPTPTHTPSPTPTFTPTPTATPAQTPTPIPQWKTNINDGDEVAHTMTLVAEYSGRVDNDLWVFVVTSAGRYYPQSFDMCRGAVTPGVGGKWEVRIGLGESQPTEAGNKFDIVLATAKSQLDSQFISLRMMAWCLTGPAIGFETLPTEVAEVYRIKNVVRSSELWGKAPTVSNAQLPGEVNITNLSSGAVVTATTLIAGDYTPDAVDDIWVLIYPIYGRWYPQSETPCRAMHTRKVGGRWQVPGQFGGGEIFDVVVVSAAPAASEFFQTRQQVWCTAGYYPGLLTIELPDGLDEKARIRVRRSP